MKIPKITLSLLAAITMIWAGAAELPLLSDYVIARPDASNPTEKKAAGELAHYLERVTGAPFTVVAEESVAPGQKAIYVGQSAYARANGIDFDALDQEEWIIRTTPDGNLILTGGKLRGILYAVYEFLEKQGGVLWLDETVEVVPPNPELTIGEWDMQRKPYFGIRWIFDRLDWFPAAGQFKERNKGFSYSQSDNGMARIIGGKRPHHTFWDYCSEWPKEKVELFSLNDAGERVIPISGDGPGQICMTNPEARSLTLAQLRKFIAEDRREAAEKGYPAPMIYDISQNDNYQKCVCPSCKELAEREGSYSAPLLDFTNHVAREIRKEYPDIFIRTFAYQYSEKPPAAMKAEDNVIIHLALVGIEFGGSYYTYDTQRSLAHPFNTATRDLIESWATHTKHIARWDYWTLYPMNPEPYVRAYALKEDLEFYKAQHVSFLFAEYENPHWNNFFALTRFLGYKLMDDPDADAEALIATFLPGYYGAAAPEMRALLDYMQLRQDNYDKRIAGVDVSCRSYLDDDFFATALNLLQCAAENTADDPKAHAHVQRERLPIIAGLMMRWKYLTEPEKHYDHTALLKEFHAGTLASLEHYFPDDSNGFKSEIRRELEKAEQRFAANAINEAIPEELGHVAAAGQAEDLNALHFLREGMRAQLSDDPAAFHGKAMTLPLVDTESIPFTIDNWMDGGTMARVELKRDQIATDGNFHWLPLGEVTFANNGRAHLFVPDMTGIRCDFYRRFEAGSRYDVYVSARFTGPAFVPGATGENVLSVDRLIFMPKE